MVKAFSFCFIVCAIIPFTLQAQTVQYSKGTVRFEDKDNVEIAGTFNKTLHVLKENAWGAIDLLMYGANLNLVERKPLQSEKEGYAAIEVMPFHDFYYVLLKYSKHNKYRFLKISASGEIEDKTDLLKRKFSTALVKDNAPENITKVQNRLFFVNHYFDQSKQKLFIRILSMDSLFLNSSERLIALDYKFGVDIINNVLFTDTGTAYILHSFRNLTPNHGQVEIIKYDLASGRSNQLNLASAVDNFHDPDLKFNSADSSLFFVAKVTGKKPTSSQGELKRYYYVKMNKELEEVSPSMLVQIKSGKNERVVLTSTGGPAFVLDDNKQSQLQGSTSTLSSTSTQNYNVFWGATESVIYSDPFSLLSADGTYMQIPSQIKQPYPKPENIPARFDINLKRTDVDMRIVTINGISGKKSDILFNAKNGKFLSQYFNSFIITANKGYSLFFTTTYSLYRRGISYVTINEGKISNEEFLKVDQKYEYMLPLAKKISEQAFIIPYAFKNQLGLIKVEF